MALLPDDRGVVHDTVTRALPLTAATSVGAPGTERETTTVVPGAFDAIVVSGESFSTVETGDSDTGVDEEGDGTDEGDVDGLGDGTGEGAGDTVIAGFTAALGFEVPVFPALFVAVTVNVYDVPFFNPVTTQELSDVPFNGTL